MTVVKKLIGRRRVRILGVAAGSIALMLVTALPAGATWHRTTEQGSPGPVTPLSPVGAQGGICGAPGETTCINNNYDQVYVDRFRVGVAPYNTAQDINAKAYIYHYINGSWTLHQTKNEGTCNGLPANGSLVCNLGSTAPDEGGAANAVPAFYPLPQGYSWTVVVRVSWYRYSDGALLSYADYRPSNMTNDLNCAGFAQYQVSPPRCTGPFQQAGTGIIFINMPVGGL